VIRFIVEQRCSVNGLETRAFKTIDFHVPELENLLIKGGLGEDSYEYWQLVGVEIKNETL
jgi:hypothetical protein